VKNSLKGNNVNRKMKKVWPTLEGSNYNQDYRLKGFISEIRLHLSKIVVDPEMTNRF